ncbi:MAG: hypothetical protein QE487_17135 [Fluviicola sp.]|nr:hypothetical protein [Fluviicola sp.]
MLKTTCLLVLPIAFLFCSCKSSVNVHHPEPLNKNVDTNLIAESHNETDIPLNDYMKEELAPIRANFKRINSIKKWSKVVQKDVYQSSEGGYVCFYYLNDKIEKIVERNFGETGQAISEFYILGGELSFVLKRSYNYNRPIYWDSTQMKESNDTEVFDFEKSEILEDRSYFIKGQMVHAIISGDCGAPFNQEFLDQEGKQIIEHFNELMMLATKQ